MNPLLEQFLQEARENLMFIEQHLEELEGADAEMLNSIFRSAHTLKGGSGIVGFESLKNITHKAEDLLDLLRSNKIDFHPDMVSALFDAFDEVVNLVEAAEEQGDVVDADPEVEQKIIGRLLAVMGKDQEKEAEFRLPFTLLDDKAAVVNLDYTCLSGLQEKIPFAPETITQDNLNKRRLYGIVFDVTQDCMVFGNDPVYVLSLLQEDLVGIDFCIDKDEARTVLEMEATDDDDHLMLQSAITAIVYSDYETIEEALYNFIDDLLILPLDITTLLSVEKSETAGAEYFKDIAKGMQGAIATKDIAALKQALEPSLDMLNLDTTEGARLKRLYGIAHLIDAADLSKLPALLDFLPFAEAAPAQEEAAGTGSAVVADDGVEFGAIDAEVARELLQQQLTRIRKVKEDDVWKNVAVITARCMRAIGKDPVDLDSHEAVLAVLEEILEGKKTESADGKPTESATQSVISAAGPEISSKPSSAGATKAAPASADQKKDVIGKVVKVKQESIDHLMSVVGELLVAKNSLPYLAESVAHMESDEIRRAVLEKYSFINRLTNQLQDLIMSMRMLPISYVFDRYPKLVRDISRNLNKKVKLTQEGGETKLDKNMIEMLADPLIHIVRNSLDHGVESPEDRKAKGKDETGHVIMKAYPQSDKVIIEIHDDGKGIDGERVVRKVMEKGLVPLEKLEAMSDQEKVSLITLPGLSTAEQISEYSGRGVGMDVVKKSLQEFGGNLEIKSEINKGTKITLAIPVSLAVTTLLHVSMQNSHYGFPMEYVSETVKIEKEEITYLNNEPFIYIREQVIPLLFIEKMLDMEKMQSGPLSIVVLNIKGNNLAVVVNELLGQLDVVQKPMEGLLASHPIISGTALLGNGSIIMIMDPFGLMSVYEAIKREETIEEVV